VERAAVEALVGPLANRPVWLLIRAAEASVAEMAIVPAQDLLELGSAARMNTPAVPSGNWSWRAPEKCWTDELAARLAALAEVTTGTTIRWANLQRSLRHRQRLPIRRIVEAAHVDRIVEDAQSDNGKSKDSGLRLEMAPERLIAVGQRDVRMNAAFMTMPLMPIMSAGAVGS